MNQSLKRCLAAGPTPGCSTIIVIIGYKKSHTRSTRAVNAKIRDRRDKPERENAKSLLTLEQLILRNNNRSVLRSGQREINDCDILQKRRLWLMEKTIY